MLTQHSTVLKLFENQVQRGMFLIIVIITGSQLNWESTVLLDLPDTAFNCLGKQDISSKHSLKPRINLNLFISKSNSLFSTFTLLMRRHPKKQPNINTGWRQMHPVLNLITQLGSWLLNRDIIVYAVQPSELKGLPGTLRWVHWLHYAVWGKRKGILMFITTSVLSCTWPVEQNNKSRLLSQLNHVIYWTGRMKQSGVPTTGTGFSQKGSFLLLPTPPFSLRSLAQIILFILLTNWALIKSKNKALIVSFPNSSPVDGTFRIQSIYGWQNKMHFSPAKIS